MIIQLLVLLSFCLLETFLKLDHVWQGLPIHLPHASCDTKYVRRSAEPPLLHDWRPSRPWGLILLAHVSGVLLCTLLHALGLSMYRNQKASSLHDAVLKNLDALICRQALYPKQMQARVSKYLFIHSQVGFGSPRH